MPRQRRKGVDMTDHGFGKIDFSSDLRKIKEMARELSEHTESVVSTHVVLSDRDKSKPTYSIIALCKGLGLKSGATEELLDAIVSKAGYPPHSTETLLSKFTYKNGRLIPPGHPHGHPHAFGCDMADEP
jgi:hypothetical protein